MTVLISDPMGQGGSVVDELRRRLDAAGIGIVEPPPLDSLRSDTPVHTFRRLISRIASSALRAPRPVAFVGVRVGAAAALAAASDLGSRVLGVAVLGGCERLVRVLRAAVSCPTFDLDGPGAAAAAADWLARLHGIEKDSKEDCCVRAIESGRTFEAEDAG